MKILDADFVTSAAGAAGVPRDRLPQVAFVGRSNVGKSSLINALVRRRVARTSAAPGKTRLINFYRVRLAPAPGLPDALYLADLPGYGYARGGAASAAAFEALAGEYFGAPDGGPCGAVLAVDARHPGLPPDLAAYGWLADRVPVVPVATKTDTLGRAARARAHRELEHSLKARILPVSAATGEGLDALWKLIATLIRKPGAGGPPPPSSSRR